MRTATVIYDVQDTAAIRFDITYFDNFNYDLNKKNINFKLYFTLFLVT